jgi:hypothetical protein
VQTLVHLLFQRWKCPVSVLVNGFQYIRLDLLDNMVMHQNLRDVAFKANVWQHSVHMHEQHDLCDGWDDVQGCEVS